MRFFTLIFLVLFFLFCPYHLYAAEISFSNAPQIIQKDQEITLDVTVNGAASQTTNYIRAAFFHADSPTSYFGYIFNNSNSWYNGTPSPIDPKQFLQVQIGDEGSWNGQLKIKTDTENPYFKGNGQYYLKVGRYTASATSVSNWSQAIPIEIQGVDSTPTLTTKPTATPKQTATPKPTASLKEPVGPTIIKTGLITSLAPQSSYENNYSEISQAEQDTNREATKSPNILGINTFKKNRKSLPEQITVVNASRSTSSIFIISGAVILIIGCGILLIRAYNKQKAEDL